jgi:hypothetical protein
LFARVLFYFTRDNIVAGLRIVMLHENKY